ncbi:hypothetical protein BH09ACT6_BH09ACT6_05900 [soil metagenome]
MSAVVEARFAGGRLTVDTKPIGFDGGTGVTFVAPGYELDLWPDEARKLAIALIEYAARAEKTDDGWPDADSEVTE